MRSQTASALSSRKNILRAIILQTTAVLLVSIVSVTVHSQSLHPTRITIYKGGIAHVIKEGTLQFKDHVAILNGNTNPLLGTYWLSGEKNMSMQFGSDTVKIKHEISDFYGVLSASQNKRVDVIYLDGEGDRRTISGEVLKYYPSTHMLKMRTLEGVQFFDLSQLRIWSVMLQGEESGTYSTDSIYRVTKVFSKSDKQEQDAELHYVGTGFTWQPSYYLRLLNDTIARLEMKALVENFAEPLNNVDADLVIGSPNLMYGTTLDPLVSPSLDYALDDVTGLTSGIALSGSRGTSNSIRLNSVSEVNTVDNARVMNNFQNVYATSGSKSYDLFHYSLGSITIPENTKAYFPIFAQKTPYEEVFDATLGDHVNYYANLYVNSNDNTADVNHSVKLKNRTEYPFTTAPVVVEDQNQQFLAQDRIIYTPLAGEVTINLSKAIDVVLKNHESEEERDLSYKKIQDVKYGLETIRGTVTVQNYQKKTIKVDVKKMLTGDVIEAKGATIDKTPNSSVNPSSVIKWQVELKPGEKKEVSYRYEVLFVPRGI